ncbi:sensor histidine kinase [Methylobrevis pamukkalensis]|uniref:histidine kinase n=1 Tax=Methylobrevis pamukkalensis TaxID=1439726 RepID=A0A1E3H679_9HYPH|nr:sensor histidine kinase [Methylobrevis pamukkalensis]ODN71827.1 Blue-light-activated histidine kinase 2 [Methylobrevis pamukkalensis]
MQPELEARDHHLMLEEVRHRLSNSYQLVAALVRTQLRAASGQEARERLEWVVETVTSLARLQKSLASLGGATFDSYLHEACAVWRDVWTHQDINIEVDADKGLQLPDDVAINIALILNELLTNCFEHAFRDGRSGTIHVRLKRDTDTVAHLTVRDDGCGLAPDSTIETLAGQGSLGLSLSRSLAAGIGARLHIGPASPCGTLARIDFPF